MKKRKNYTIKFILCCNMAYHSITWADLNSEIPSQPLQMSDTKSNSNENEVKKSPKKPPQTSNSVHDIEEHNSKLPIYFSGQKADVSKKTGLLNLSGNVSIMQDRVMLKSDQAQLISPPGALPSNTNNKFQKALLIGHVQINKKSSINKSELKASCDKATFFVIEKKLLLEGKAKVWKLNEYLNGDKIQIDLNSGNIEIMHPEGTLAPQEINAINTK